ncbi:MAG: hypothetical protein RJA81_613 [Planctomycetota bacterium]|jgi:uncharacterized membrane-anchored protein YhcB (DUF1043 family)
MAASNDNQGLKIAVAALATFTVLFASTTYYFYSEGSKAKSQAADATKKASEAVKLQNTAEETVKNLGIALGYANLKVNETGGFPDIDNLKNSIAQTVVGLRKNAEDQIRQKLPEAAQLLGNRGGMGDNLSIVLEDQENAAKKITQNANADVNTLVTNLNGLVKAAVDTEVAFFLDNFKMRKALADVNSIHEGQLKTVQDELAKVKADLEEVQKTHEDTRMGLASNLDDLRRDYNLKDAEHAAIQGELASSRAQHAQERADLLSNLRNERDRNQRKEDVLDVKDGTITFVDYSTKQVRLDVTRDMGIRPTQRFTIFDRKAVGLPSDKPKGQIEITEVGTQFSMGRIVETRDLAKPIVAGDLLYSAAWNASEPQEFALIGKLDLNQDGKDDRDDIERLIRFSGGKVVYQLDLKGSEIVEDGKLLPKIAWYVDDDRPISAERRNNMTQAEQEFELRKSEVLREARSLGIRPLPLSRLPGTLGYTFRNMRTSPVEGVDLNTMNQLGSPDNNQNVETPESNPNDSPLFPGSGSQVVPQ